MANWIQRGAQAIFAEYDRRIRRASQVTDYGTPHEHADAPEADHRAGAIIDAPPRTVLPPRDNHHGDRIES